MRTKAMPTTKIQAEPQKAPTISIVTHRPALPQKRDEPVRPSRVAQAADTLAAPEQGGAANRARLMRAMQGSVGNARVSRMLAAPIQTKLHPNALHRTAILAHSDPAIQRQSMEHDVAAPLLDQVDEADDLASSEAAEPASGNAPGEVPSQPASPALIQRKILLSQPTTGSGPTWHEMTPVELTRFARRRLRRSRDYAFARRIIEDMQSAGDDFRFDSENELRLEILKRITTSRQMQTTQRDVGGRRAFGYPFTSPSLYWGPRVNFAARAYWTPAVVDGYSERRDSTKRSRIQHLPRGQRHTVYGDPAPGYSWTLTPAGQADPYEAITQLFVSQPAHKRTLLHCDYLVSLVHYQSFAAAVGKAEFNRRLIAFGVHRIRLRWNAFQDLELTTVVGGTTVPGVGSLQAVRPSSPQDLVIGDHVVFWNHRAYDLINRAVGNAWRLENAVLIDRQHGQDIFLGHGSGQKTAQQLHAKLAEEYNDVARQALRLIAATHSRTPTTRHSAELDLASRFPNLHRVGSEWHVWGTDAGGHPYDEKLRLIRPDEVIGLYDPRNPGQMNLVRRPVESR